MRIRDMFSSAVSLLQNENMTKTLFFPDSDAEIRATERQQNDLGASENRTVASLADFQVETRDLEEANVDIKYNTGFEMDGSTWKVVRIVQKNQIFVKFSARIDSRISARIDSRIKK